MKIKKIAIKKEVNKNNKREEKFPCTDSIVGENRMSLINELINNKTDIANNMPEKKIFMNMAFLLFLLDMR